MLSVNVNVSDNKRFSVSNFTGETIQHRFGRSNGDYKSYFEEITSRIRKEERVH